MVVDLAAVTFLDSSALGAIVGLFRRLRERDGRLRIVQPTGAASRIFEHTGLDAVLDLYAGSRRGAQRSERVKRMPRAGAVPARPDLDVLGNGTDDREAHAVLAERPRRPTRRRSLVEAGPVVLDDDLEQSARRG